jgi:hypothetical protein
MPPPVGAALFANAREQLLGMRPLLEGYSYTAFRMEKVYSSKEWDDAPMPNSIFFTQRGHAIHGSFDKRLASQCHMVVAYG